MPTRDRCMRRPRPRSADPEARPVGSRIDSPVARRSRRSSQESATPASAGKTSRPPPAPTQANKLGHDVRAIAAVGEVRKCAGIPIGSCMWPMGSSAAMIDDGTSYGDVCGCVTLSPRLLTFDLFHNAATAAPLPRTPTARPAAMTFLQARTLLALVVLRSSSPTMSAMRASTSSGRMVRSSTSGDGRFVEQRTNPCRSPVRLLVREQLLARIMEPLTRSRQPRSRPNSRRPGWLRARRMSVRRPLEFARHPPILR